MLRLILLRHAKAVREHEAPSDKERGLTDRGLRDAHAAAKALCGLNLQPQVAIVSGARRTRETAAPVCEALGLVPHVREDLYLVEADRIWSAARGCGADRVLVIGHNPGLHDLVVDLMNQTGERSAAERALRAGFPTAAFAAFDLSGEILEAAGPRLVAAWRPDKP